MAGDREPASSRKAAAPSRSSASWHPSAHDRFGTRSLECDLRLVYAGAVTSRTPIPTRLDEDEIAALDEVVSAGLASNRAEAIRLSIRRMKDALDRARIGDEIVSGYMAMPQTKEELAAARVSAVALLDAESWSEYESTPERAELT